jgi:hypothetical protein
MNSKYLIGSTGGSKSFKLNEKYEKSNEILNAGLPASSSTGTPEQNVTNDLEKEQEEKVVVVGKTKSKFRN